MNNAKERPIPFSGPMIRAILDGRKTQTRRVVKPQPVLPDGFTECRWNTNKLLSTTRGVVTETYDPPIKNSEWWYCSTEPYDYHELDDGRRIPISRQVGQHQWKCPYGKPGDRLWVREKHWRGSLLDRGETLPVIYPGDPDFDDESLRVEGYKKYPSIHMPRWASRILLEVTDIRVERVQDISIEDCKAEGIESASPFDHYGRIDFASLWDSINAGRGYGWDVNPWAWVVDFTVIDVKGR